MMKRIAFLLLIILSLSGCRTTRNVCIDKTQTVSDETGVALRRVDSLWSSFAEMLQVKIEFYGPTSQPCKPDSNVNVNEVVADLPQSSKTDLTNTLNEIIKKGDVKSIELTKKQESLQAAVNNTDSIAASTTVSATTETTDKKTETRSDAKFFLSLLIVAAFCVATFLIPYMLFKNILK